MTDENESQEHKSVNFDTKEKKPRKNRTVTAIEKIQIIEKETVEVEERLRGLKKKKKAKEIEFNKKLYFLIGKAVWGYLEDKKISDVTEYNEQFNKLKKLLTSIIKTNADKDFLNSIELIEPKE